MDLRLLRYFVAVAEYEHVGKAARQLHISQSPLSRQIRQLEQELSLTLFQREKQRVHLTESGQWLLTEARRLLTQSERLREEARERAAGKIGLLCVSFTSTAMWSGLVPNALARFQHQFPGVTIQLENLRSANQIERIRSGRVDLGFVSFRPVDPELGVTCVSREPLSLAVPQAHPLARRKKLAPRDLDDLPWILLTDTLAPRKQAPFQAACARAGITPKSVRQVSEPTTLLALVSSGLGIGLIRKSASNYSPRMVTFLPLPWLPLTVGTFLIRKTGIADPIADAFAAYFPEHTTE